MPGGRLGATWTTWADLMTSVAGFHSPTSRSSPLWRQAPLSRVNGLADGRLRARRHHPLTAL